MFAAMMVPHHEQAIEMAELALSNSSNQKIIELAQEIKAAQAPEIELLSSWAGSMLGVHDGHQMAGMLNDDELKKLAAASGAEFDRLFLTGMIKHHQGAIEMAQDVLTSINAEVVELAKSIIDTQQAEIVLMQQLLNSIS